MNKPVRKENNLLALQEAAAARTEHPKFAVPFRVRINGRHYEGIEISLVGMTALGLIDPVTSGPLDGRIEFLFSGFSVEVDARLNLLRASIGSGVIEFAFADAMGTHRIPLQSIFNAYIAGELTQVPGLLGGKSPMVKLPADTATPQSAGWLSRLPRLFKGLLFAAAAVGLLAFIAERVYQRAFVYAPESVVRVAGDTIEIVSRKTGTVVGVDAAAAPGQVLASVLGDGSALSNYTMPCDCTVVRMLQGPGDAVEQGEPIAVVLPKDGEVFIATEVSAKLLPRLRSGSSVVVGFADGSSSRAVLKDVLLEDGKTPGLVPVTFSTDESLTAQRIGEVVSLSVDSFPVFRDRLASFFTLRTE